MAEMKYFVVMFIIFIWLIYPIPLGFMDGEGFNRIYKGESLEFNQEDVSIFELPFILFNVGSVYLKILVWGISDIPMWFQTIIWMLQLASLGAIILILKP